MLAEIIHETGLFGKLTLLVGLVPLIVAGAYAWRPAERKLALMRVVSLSAMFAALSGVSVGLISVLMALAVVDSNSGQRYMGLAEALGPAFLNFGALSAAWLLVGAGMMRRTM